MDEPEEKSDRAIEKPVEPPQGMPDPSSKDRSAAPVRKSIRTLNFHDEQFNALTRGTQIGALARMTGSGALGALAKELAARLRSNDANSLNRARTPPHRHPGRDALRSPARQRAAAQRPRSWRHGNWDRTSSFEGIGPTSGGWSPAAGDLAHAMRWCR